jgi:hypothetical protein
VAAVAVAVLTLAGDEDDTADAPPAAVGVEDLEAALLTIEDVGSDYMVDFVDDGGGDTPDADEIDTSDECRLALVVLEGANGAPSGQQVAAHFVNDVDGTVQHDIMLPGDGHPDLDTIRGAMDQCDRLEYEGEEGSGSFAYETSEVDGLGDRAFSVVMDAEVWGAGRSVAFQLYGVFWERDGVVSHVSGFGGIDPVTFTALPTDRDEVDRLAAMTDERLTDVLAG